jgi:glycosyltransferase involved in cell wall biosynthesis
MNIGIYSELYEGAGLGGREYIVAILCDALAQQGHAVEYVHHLPALTREEFSARFGIRPETVRLRYVPHRPRATLRQYSRSRRARQHWNRSLSCDYDVFINIVHGAPARSYARHGVLMILFPFFQPFDVWSGRRLEGHGRSRAWVFARYVYHRLKWRGLMDSYELKTSISEYSRAWTQRRWGVESTVIYPPADSTFTPGEKSNSILSVGRFSGFRVAGLSKRHLEMMRTFAEICGDRLEGWQYHSVGGLGSWPQDVAYFREVEELAGETNGQAHAEANAPRDQLKHLYATAKIFWHAAGYGDDDTKHPELMEHFGIATVDAMSAGCVPVVIRKGAQPEIVEHGISGFLWNSLHELREYTVTLAKDDALRSKMAAAARVRAQEFSGEAFIRRFQDFVAPILRRQ